MTKSLQKIKKIIAGMLKRWLIAIILLIVLYFFWLLFFNFYMPLYSSVDSEYGRFEIDKITYQKVIDNFLQRENNLIKIINREYSNPFN